MNILTGLEPQRVFRYFEEICSIPHGSGNTKKISDYLVTFAKEHDLHYIQDEMNNVILFKDGTKGYENSSPVILQGHMDMVCEKEADCDIDFQNEGLQLELKDGIISAAGTTLGGDDGIAVAYMLAILSSDDLSHPPIEAVVTVDEEIGMLGAAALDCSPLKSRTLINIDSEDEGFLLVSCAGGVTATAHIPVNYTSQKGICALLTVDGLQGGHSGVEIDKGRANACTLLGRTLYQLQKKQPFHILSIKGGLKDNAIPRQAEALLLFAPASSLPDIKKDLQKCQAVYTDEYTGADPDIRLQVKAIEPEPDAPEAMDTDSTKRVITALMNFPNGIQKMSRNIEGMVQTSLNLGILTSDKKEVRFSYAVRSSVSSEKEYLTDQLRCLAEQLDGSLTTSGSYPAWEYRKDSPLRDLMVQIFKKQYHREPVVQSIHAGVECGLFAGKIPGLDCVSFGPDMKDIHTPNESMDVESVKRTWNYLKEVLRELR